jgi:predicted MFS family arabinose efflux permease
MSTKFPNRQFTEKTARATSTRLPLSGLLALAMTGFIAILTETLPAGLLPEISHGLGVPESWTGQLVTLYAALSR